MITFIFLLFKLKGV